MSLPTLAKLPPAEARCGNCFFGTRNDGDGVLVCFGPPPIVVVQSVMVDGQWAQRPLTIRPGVGENDPPCHIWAPRRENHHGRPERAPAKSRARV